MKVGKTWNDEVLVVLSIGVQNGFVFQHKFESEQEHRYLLQLLSNLDLALFNQWIFLPKPFFFLTLKHFHEPEKLPTMIPSKKTVSVTAQPFVGNPHTLYTSKNRKKTR